MTYNFIIIFLDPAQAVQSLAQGAQLTLVINPDLVAQNKTPDLAVLRLNRYLGKVAEKKRQIFRLAYCCNITVQDLNENLVCFIFLNSVGNRFITRP